MLSFAPRITIAALKGGSGKTIVSLGLCSAWREKGLKVASFKKGPDFIDSGWLSFATGISCHNLDQFMMSSQCIVESFLGNSISADISLIEGNRGIFDGLDPYGCCSTAELARLIKSPVLLIADVTMSTRTIAALIMGCQKFDPDLNIAGIILNRVAGKRQEKLIKESIAIYCNIPVVGTIPKFKQAYFPERHMGLVPHQERSQADEAIKWARKVVEENLDMETIWNLAHDVEPMESVDAVKRTVIADIDKETGPDIGYILDSSFWFYYPENLDHLRELGANLIKIDSIIDKELPAIDALYIGGGFPETRAEALASNRSFRNSLKQAIDKGLPVYAECGGLIYLGEELVIRGKSYPMVGALPVRFDMEKKPQGHGYTILKVIDKNPYYPIGTTLKGHEFHYSRPTFLDPGCMKPVFRVDRGHGFDGKTDGLWRKNMLATYTHLHASGMRFWGECFYKSASKYQKKSK